MTSHKQCWDRPPQIQDGIRYAYLVLLAGVILGVGAYTDLICKGLEVAIGQLVQALGLGDVYQAVLKNTPDKITMRSLPAMLAYGLGYCSLCLLTLYVYLRERQKFLLALVCYAGAFALCFGLVVLGKVLGDWAPVYNLARRLIEMILSPLPIVLLLSAFSFAGKGMNGKQA